MLMECVFMLNYSKSLEVTYSGKPAQYLWYLPNLPNQFLW